MNRNGHKKLPKGTAKQVDRSEKLTRGRKIITDKIIRRNRMPSRAEVEQRRKLWLFVAVMVLVIIILTIIFSEDIERQIKWFSQ